jgi:hypothetical protein
MIAERHDARRRTVAAVLWRLLQMTLLPLLTVWIVPWRVGRSATKGAL